MYRTWKWAVIVALTAFFAIGCQSKQHETKQSLKILGLAYHAHHDEKNHGPASWQELENLHLEGIEESLPKARTHLESKGYDVIWGVRFPLARGGTANFILAFPRDVSINGGTVLMLDASIREVTPDEFKKLFETQKEESSRAMTDYLNRGSSTESTVP
jgi:hypothetical protein